MLFRLFPTRILAVGTLFLTLTAVTALSSIVPAKGQAVRSLTGTVIELRRNRIVIEEETTHRRLKFYYMKRDIGTFRAGERVRIYYSDRRIPVISVKSLTPLEFTTGQNLGYITGRPGKDARPVTEYGVGHGTSQGSGRYAERRVHSHIG